MYFDRYDICEAYSLLAHDWGLYDVHTRLHNMGFKPSPILAFNSLSDNGKEIFNMHDTLLTENHSLIRSDYR